MKTQQSNVISYFLLYTLLFLLAGNNVWANDDEYHKTVAGMDVYIGIIPVEIIQGRKLLHELNMHGGETSGKNLYHLVVALFDKKSMKRISTVKIKANISVPESSGSTKFLDKMEVNNIVTYGNYFSFPRTTPYYIRLNLDVPGKNQTDITFKFNRLMN
jgi:hypothetical protein